MVQISLRTLRPCASALNIKHQTSNFYTAPILTFTLTSSLYTFYTATNTPLLYTFCTFYTATNTPLLYTIYTFYTATNTPLLYTFYTATNTPLLYTICTFYTAKIKEPLQVNRLERPLQPPLPAPFLLPSARNRALSINA